MSTRANSAASPDNLQLLELYRKQLAEIEKAMAELRRQQAGLMAVVQGLELLTGSPDELRRRAEILLAEAPTTRIREGTEGETTTLEKAVRAMQLSPNRNPRGAMEIRRLIQLRLGPTVNYQTLYKSLKRDAEKHNGRVYQEGDKFGLREWKEVQGA